MSYYVLNDGRIVSDKSMIGNYEFIEVAEYPYPTQEENQIKVCVGIENGELKWKYFDIEEPKEPEPEQTQLDRIEANTKNLLLSNSALDVLLGVSDVEQDASS